jgi:uncharacterized protein (TIGR00255 family)
MTGFGKSELMHDGRKISVEVKSVNNRFLDINIRQPRFMLSYEEAVRKFIKQRLARGRVDVFINYSSEREDSKEVNVDMALVSAYLKAGRKIAAATGIEDDLTVSQMVRLPDVISYEEKEDDSRAIEELLLDTIGKALDELKAARNREGELLKKDISKRLDMLFGFADQINAKEKVVVEEYRQKLRERLNELLQNVAPDDQRIAQEVAIYADKANITEEVVRIKSHIKQFLRLADETTAQGRNMDFIVQELNREFNTIGSKSQDTGIINAVLAAKGEVEKIREQIQNIE